MNNKNLLSLYFFFTLAFIAFEYLDAFYPTLISKSLLVPLLFIYYHRKRNGKQNLFSKLISAALLFLDIFKLPVLIFYKYYLSGGVIFVSLFISMIMSIFYFFSSRTKELKHLIKDRGDVETRLKNLLKENNINLNEYTLETIYEFLVQYFEEYGEYTIRQTELNDMKVSLKDKKYMKRIKDELIDLEKEDEEISKKIEKGLSSLDNVGDVEFGIESINKMILDMNYNIKSLKEKIKVNEEILMQISEELEQSKDNKEGKEQIIIEKDKAEESLKNLNAYKSVIFFIMEIMSEAVNIRRQKQLEELAESTKEKFNFLTDKQYEKIIDSEKIKSIISGNEYGNGINQSLYHLLLLSIKLATTFLLTDFDITLPLIIDEPFMFMDEMRVGRLKEMVDDISMKRQIIIFTHNKNYRDWGSFIEL